MKRLLLTHLLVSLALFSFSQRVKIIDDPHIRAQHNRMVFKSWGNFLPNPKNFLGININPHYTLTWSYLAPTQNRRYRSGPDIRPLGPYGEQTQRTVLLFQMQAETTNFSNYADSLGKEAMSDLYHHTGGVISEVDPLWQLYYKRMLKDVYNYNLSKFTTGLTQEEKTYLMENGIIEWFDEEMQRLNERLHGAFDVTMARGSRIINYHRIYTEYQSVMNKWLNHKSWSGSFLTARKDNIKSNNIQNLQVTRWFNNDVAIMRKVIEDAKKM